MAHLTSEEVELKIKQQDGLLAQPPMSVAEREELIAWLDGVKNDVSQVMYAVMPKELWDGVPDKLLSVELLGASKHPMIPDGMYLLDLPKGLDRKYRDPAALAVAHLALAPRTIRFLPEVMSILLPEPTSHDRMGAKIFLRELATKHANDADILEWLSLLK